MILLYILKIFLTMLHLKIFLEYWIICTFSEYRCVTSPLEYFQLCQWNTALWEKKKTLVMYRVSVTKRQRDIRQHLTDFWIKKMPHFIWMFSTFREYCLLPVKQIWSHCSFMHIFEEKTFLSLLTQRHAPHYFGEIQLRLIFILQPPYL